MTPALTPLARFVLAAALAGPLPAADAPTFTFVDPAAPEVAAIRAAGESAIGALATRLMTELTTALGSGGPEHAIDVCHTSAQMLTRAPLPDLPAVKALKRTSLRVRNPANAPDPAEQAALDHVAALVAGGQPPPPVLLQRIQHPDAAGPAWRVYRPVLMQPLCLACHGNPAEQPPALRALLHERYPQDAATGYAAGDWRGLVRATVTSGTPPPAAP